MSQAIRAVYESGQLRLLDPVELVEGEQIELLILSARDAAIAALGDLVVPSPPTLADDTLDEEALMREIENALEGQTPLSETIIQERREGP